VSDKNVNKKAVVEENEVMEMRIFDNKNNNEPYAKGGKVNTFGNVAEEKKLMSSGKRLVYAPYTNAVILHDNEIGNLANIDSVLNQILREPTFLKNASRPKVDLIQWLDLSHNHLKSVHKDITNLPFLKIFYLHANYINDLDDVKSLMGCQCLINLTLHGNSIEHIKGYRHFIIEMLPKLEKLDFTLISEKELDVIHFKGARYGEIRDKHSGRVISFPKLDVRFMKILKEDKFDEKKQD